jgi:F-type H+-transporting ATPase subunit c
MKKKVTILLLAAIFLMVLVPLALAAEGAGAAPEGALSDKVGVALALGAGLCISIAAFGGAMGQGMAIKGAMDGIARNPGASGKIMTPMIIGLAMIESLVIYSLVISFMLLGKF